MSEEHKAENKASKEGKSMHIMFPIMAISALLGGGGFLMQHPEWVDRGAFGAERFADRQRDRIGEIIDRHDGEWRYWRNHRRWGGANAWHDRAELYEQIEGERYGAYHPPQSYPRYAPVGTGQGYRIPCGVYAWKPCGTAQFVTVHPPYGTRAIWRATNPRLLWQRNPGPEGWTIRDERDLRGAFNYYQGR